MTIREVIEQDFSEWLRMRELLYSDCSSEQLQTELEAVYFDRNVVGELDYTVWVNEERPGVLSGFVEISLREDAPHCDAKPVGYIESLFVDARSRRNGVALQLLTQGQDWVLRQNCREFYVDTDPACTDAIAFYESFGFKELLRRDSEILYKKHLG